MLKITFVQMIVLDNYFEYDSGKIIKSKTLPTQITFKLNKGNSLSTYLEFQKTFYYHTPTVEAHRFIYFSPSYNHFGKWTLTGFYDREDVNDKVHQWPGLDFSFYLNSVNQISLFYGSQKGGLVCANGVCADQPGLEDGIKLTFRSLF